MIAQIRETLRKRDRVRRATQEDRWAAAGMILMLIQLCRDEWHIPQDRVLAAIKQCWRDA